MCQSAGRSLGPRPKGGPGGKSGLHGHTVPDNVRRVLSPGKVPQRTDRRPHPSPLRGVTGAVRVKRCGKSAPRVRQRIRHGKPHREQDRIGTATRAVRRKAITPRERCRARRPGRLLEAMCKYCPRGMAVTYHSRKRVVPYRTRLTGRLMSMTKAVSNKTRITENEGFGAHTPDPSPFRVRSSDVSKTIAKFHMMLSPTRSTSIGGSRGP